MATKKDTIRPHDAVFKTVFEKPQNARAELQHMLAPEHVAAIDWATLKLEPGSYVDDELADQHSDLLFSAQARGSGARVLVYVLWEHQSTHEPLMSLRILSYMVRIWERFSDNEANKGEPLPLIVPALLAQVEGGWRAATRFSDLFAPNLGVMADAVLPDFSYAVDDLAKAADGDLRRRGLAIQARLALWLMRDARDAALLLQRATEWLDDLEALARGPDGERALEPLLRYLAVGVHGLHLGQFRAILSERAPTAETITMTIAEQLHAEGHAKGKSEGVAEEAITSVLTVLEAREVTVTAEARERIERCTDVETARRWLVRATTVKTVDGIFDD